MRISDWSSDVCSSDLAAGRLAELTAFLDARLARRLAEIDYRPSLGIDGALKARGATLELLAQLERCGPFGVGNTQPRRSEEHTSELQSLMRSSYAVFCLKKKTNNHKKSHAKLITNNGSLSQN